MVSGPACLSTLLICAHSSHRPACRGICKEIMEKKENMVGLGMFCNMYVSVALGILIFGVSHKHDKHAAWARIENQVVRVNARNKGP